MLLSELTADARRLALVGLAKNTGKTVALTALLAELAAAGRAVAVTSVGRDGEEHDVIDARIDKPRIPLQAGSIVATTDALLRASGLAHELLERTEISTPLGRVTIARLSQAGTVEVAGPSAASDVRAVAEEMLASGAEQVLIDGAVDRRAASSPAVSDGLVLATGAILSDDIDEVVSRTRDAVDLVRLGTDGGGEPLELPDRFALTAGEAEIGAMLDGAAGADRVVVSGAVPEAFVEELARAARRRGRRLELVAHDSTKVFLADHGPEFYERAGVNLRVQAATSLCALTVNPVAPQSHEFGSEHLRGLLAGAIADVPILDVLDPAYGAPAAYRAHGG